MIGDIKENIKREEEVDLLEIELVKEEGIYGIGEACILYIVCGNPFITKGNNGLLPSRASLPEQMWSHRDHSNEMSVMDGTKGRSGLRWFELKYDGRTRVS